MGEDTERWRAAASLRAVGEGDTAGLWIAAAPWRAFFHRCHPHQPRLIRFALIRRGILSHPRERGRKRVYSRRRRGRAGSMAPRLGSETVDALTSTARASARRPPEAPPSPDPPRPSPTTRT